MARLKVEINPVCGERLKQLIKDNGTTQKQLAKDIGVSEQTIYNVVHGKYSLTDTVAKLILERYPNYCTDLWLLGKAEYKTPEDENTAVKDRIRNGINQIFRSNLEHHERMLNVFSHLVSECGYIAEYDGFNANIKKRIDKDSLSAYDVAFYESQSFNASSEDIELLYSQCQALVQTYIRMKEQKRKGA